MQSLIRKSNFNTHIISCLCFKAIAVVLPTLCLFFVSCDGDDTKKTAPSGKYANGVWITNEGNFMSGNASISFFHLDSNVIENDVFYNVNGRNLGDVAQSITLFNGKAYLVANNSKKIEVIEALTGKSVGVINDLASPRYLLAVGAKAYITDIYADKIYVVRLSDYAILKEIKVSGWTEKMVQLGNRVYVANQRTTFDKRPGSGQLLAINIDNDQIVDSLPISNCSGEIIADSDNQLWTLRGQTNTQNAALVRVATSPLRVSKIVELPLGALPSVLAQNGQRDTLYYLQKGGVYKLSVAANTVHNQAFIPEKSYNYYGLGINPKNGDVYVSDAIDFTQSGVVFRYKQGGARIDSFRVGLIPSSFTFTE